VNAAHGTFSEACQANVGCFGADWIYFAAMPVEKQSLENEMQGENEPGPRQNPGPGKPRALGVFVKASGAILMGLSLLCVFFFAWFVEQMVYGSFILLVGWLGGFLLFLAGRALERPRKPPEKQSPQ
jgi:hypothetical protein